MKRRPAVVLSNNAEFHFPEGESKLVLAMITSSAHKAWPLDTALTDLKQAGLAHTSLVRLKIFTLDSSLVLAKIGRLAAVDAKKVKANLAKIFS